jgi:hypothetical protein
MRSLMKSTSMLRFLRKSYLAQANVISLFHRSDILCSRVYGYVVPRSYGTGTHSFTVGYQVHWNAGIRVCNKYVVYKL